MSIAQQQIPIYNTTVQKNKSYVALNVANCSCHKLKTPTGHKGGALQVGKYAIPGNRIYGKTPELINNNNYS